MFQGRSFVSDQFDKQPDPAVMHHERADATLMNFLLNSSGARLAASSLRPGAEVGITFTNIAGDWRIFSNVAGKMAFESGKAVDPDFELRIPPRAVNAICSRLDADVGDLGVAFFEHIRAPEPDLKIDATVHSGLLKLTRRGWLGVIARGGSKVVVWMAQKGLRGPGAIVTAIGRLKS
jgi:hypothetical protein